MTEAANHFEQIDQARARHSNPGVATLAQIASAWQTPAQLVAVGLIDRSPKRIGKEHGGHKKTAAR